MVGDHMAAHGEEVFVDLAQLDNKKDDHHDKQNSYTLSERIGLDELLSQDVLITLAGPVFYYVLRASLAELFGAACLIFMADGIVISTLETDIALPNLVMGVLIGITIAILILALFPVSGGHLSPVITLSAALLGLISLSRAVMYITGQCIGSILGALAFKAVVSKPISDKFSLAGCSIRTITPGQNGPITTGISTVQAFWMETFCSFCLLLSAFWAAYYPKLKKSVGLVMLCSVIGAVVAVLVFVSTAVTAVKGYAGAGMNPARCFGAAVVRGGHLWDGHWVFWVGPTVACFAFYFYAKAVSDDEEFRLQGQKHDFIGIIRALLTYAKND